MHYLKYIEEACAHLRSLGIDPEVSEGFPVTEEILHEAELVMQMPLPHEIRSFLMEMGDGFQLSYSAEPITGDEDNQFYWGINSLGGIVSAYSDLRDEMLKNASGSGEYCDTEECKEESRKRSKWVPFYGIGGGGYTLCIDSGEGEGNGEIRYHDIRFGDGHFPSIHLASDFDALIRQWSRYCFSEPLWDGTDKHGDLVSYCWEKEGAFDWAPNKFRQEFDRKSKR